LQTASISTVLTAGEKPLKIETVSEVLSARDTPLKRGVNESAWWLMKYPL
jgi:hypothetical protein